MIRSELPEEIQKKLDIIRPMVANDIDYEIIVLIIEAAYIKGKIDQADKGVFG